jgi:hypothetical protein
LIRAHLIPRQLLKRVFPKGVVRDDEGRWVSVQTWMAAGRADASVREARTLQQLIDDERSWVPCCGGIAGVSGHHGMLDTSRKLRIARAELPPAVEEFAAELGLVWWLDREYGVVADAA